MIFSSADILKTLSRNEIIRLSASVSIVDGKPSLTGSEDTRIYIDRFPRVDEFQATWFIYIESDDSVELIIAELKRLLPSVRVSSGLLTTVTTTDFIAESTQKAPEAPKVQAVQVNLTQYEERFQSLVEDVQDQMLLVSSGRAGKDGKDGLPGAPGRDGKDIDATKTELEDLANVDEGIAKEKGQVLTWDGSKWTNLYARQSSWITGGSESKGAASSVSSTIVWTYHPHDHTQEPNPGHFHTDSADGELVTTFHVSNDTSRGNDIEILLRDLLQQGYDRVYVALADDPSQAHLYAITGYTETTGGFELTVTHVETAGAEPDYQNAKGYEFLFTKSAIAVGGGIPEAPQDGSYYVRQNGAWVNLSTALSAAADGGNFN